MLTSSEGKAKGEGGSSPCSSKPAADGKPDGA